MNKIMDMRYSKGGLDSGLSVTLLGTKTNEGSRIVNSTEALARQHAQNATFGLFAAANLFRVTGWFHIHFFIHLRFSCEVWDVWSRPCSGDLVAIGRAVMYYARASHAFSAGIKCRRCI